MSSFPGGASGQEPAANAGAVKTWSHPWIGKIPWRRAQQPTPGFLPREPHRQRSMEDYGP